MKPAPKEGKDRSVPEVTVATLRAKYPGLAKRAESSPLAAIKLHCLDCAGEGTIGEVDRCETAGCPLHPFRMGRRPGPGRQLTEEQRKAAGDRLAAARAARIAEDQDMDDDAAGDEVWGRA
jgi:hypothetical protein